MTRNPLVIFSLSLNLLLLALSLAGWLGPNVLTSFNPEIDTPIVADTAFVHPLAAVIGAVSLGERVVVAPGASIRGDEGQSIYIGDQSNVQDGVVIHGLETFDDEQEIPEDEVEVAGQKYSVYIGKRVSLAHQSQVHGPATIGDETFVGMQALVFKSEGGDHVIIEPGAKIIGVTIPPHRYVPALTAVTRQEQADALPRITEDYSLRRLNQRVVHVNLQLAAALAGTKRNQILKP